MEHDEQQQRECATPDDDAGRRSEGVVRGTRTRAGPCAAAARVVVVVVTNEGN